MNLFDGERRGLFPRAEQRGGGLFRPSALAQLHQPGTTTFTNRAPMRGGGESRPDPYWEAILHNEGGTGPNGEFLTSRRGAVGPAQVMPGTAPEAARLANLPWDERRYRTDAAYNIALGRAYYREQLRVFGDPAMAAAAYNAGPGRMRRALEAARRRGGPWEGYLPRETRDYVRNFRARVGSGQSE